MKRYEDFWAWTVFWKAIKCGSLTQAAISLGIDPAVASRLITDLERSVGTKLLNRRRRPLTATPAGDAYYEEVGPLIAEYQRFVARHFEDTVFSYSPYLRSIRVSGPQLYGQERLRPLLNEYRQAHAHAMFCSYLERSPSDLSNRSIDALVTTLPVRRPDLLAFEIRTIPKLVLCSPSYLENHGEPRTPDDLNKHVGLELLNGNSPGAGHFIYRGRERAAFSFERTYYSENATMLRESAIQGEGILFDLPVEYAGKALEEGSLVQILKGWHCRPSTRIIAMRQEDAVGTNAIYDFVQWLVRREREETLRRETQIFTRLNENAADYV